MHGTLYKDPDLFNLSHEASSNRLERLHGCLKAGKDSYAFGDKQSEVFNEENKVQGKLNKMHEKPVILTKAERMMAKMGWHGGALGKFGDGIIVPIAPNSFYAQNKFGLGHTVKRFKSSMKKVKKELNKEHFETNVLFHILDFVKNDFVYKFAFDCHLCKRERKWVHQIVEALANSEKTVNIHFDTIVQNEIAQEIFKFNRYSLTTESEGVFPNRSLYLYKEATKTIYLITPDDLKEDAATKSNVDSKTFKEQTGSMSSNNSEALNISKNIKNPNNIVNNLLKVIIDYFTKFIEDDNYKEFSFLGPFNSEEIVAINSFVDLYSAKPIKNR